jgi:hypothetical protein
VKELIGDADREHLLIDYALHVRKVRAEVEALAAKLAHNDPSLRRALDTIEKWLWV